MRQDHLRDTSDRGRRLLEYEVKPATDRVDREHIPSHLQEIIETSINDQERVSMLNYYLQVTGREPRVADELGWNRTRNEPTLFDNAEVGYGYALGSQHQHHCANTLADAIDLGKDNINDFYLLHIIHRLFLIKIYSEKLDFYREPVQPLTDIARSRLEKGFKMSDWEDENGNIINKGMLLRNPEMSVVIQDLRSTLEERKEHMSGWVIFVIVEAVISSLLLTIIGTRWFLASRRRAIPLYVQVQTDPTESEALKPEKVSFGSNDPSWAQ